MTLVVLAGISALALDHAGRRSIGALGLGLLAVLDPLIAIAAAVGWLARVRWNTAAAASGRLRAADDDVGLLVDLLSLALASGKTIRSSFEAAAPHIHPDLGFEVAALLDRMDHHGVERALSVTRGRLEPVSGLVAAASASGAPLLSVVESFGERLRHERHTERVTAARRLPVRLLLPLCLLILPGFVVLAVGPAILEALARLGPIP